MWTTLVFIYQQSQPRESLHLYLFDLASKKHQNSRLNSVNTYFWPPC